MCPCRWPNKAISAGTALFAWQRLDFTDMSFMLVTCQQVYSAPETSSLLPQRGHRHNLAR